MPHGVPMLLESNDATNTLGRYHIESHNGENYAHFSNFHFKIDSTSLNINESFNTIQRIAPSLTDNIQLMLRKDVLPTATHLYYQIINNGKKYLLLTSGEDSEEQTIRAQLLAHVLAGPDSLIQQIHTTNVSTPTAHQWLDDISIHQWFDCHKLDNTIQTLTLDRIIAAEKLDHTHLQAHTRLQLVIQFIQQKWNNYTNSMKHHSVPKKVRQSKAYNITNFYGIQAILPKCEMCKAEVLPEAGLCKAHAHCRHTIKTSITQRHYAVNIRKHITPAEMARLNLPDKDTRFSKPQRTLLNLLCTQQFINSSAHINLENPIIQDSDNASNYTEFHAKPFINIAPKKVLNHTDPMLLQNMAQGVKVHDLKDLPLTAIKKILAKNSAKDRRLKSRIMYHYVPSSLTFPEHFIRNVGFLIKNPHDTNRQTTINHKKLKAWSSAIT
jgi:hypothetical protein